MTTAKGRGKEPERTGLDEDEEGVAVVKGSDGALYFKPASLRRLGADAGRLYEILQDAAMAIREYEEHIEGAVPAFREMGASWSHVGAALGITGEAARLRYRDLEEG
jgi:hypothetical protein